jgi:hypothetical protein
MPADHGITLGQTTGDPPSRTPKPGEAQADQPRISLIRLPQLTRKPMSFPALRSSEDPKTLPARCT